MNKVALLFLAFLGGLAGCRPSPFLFDPPQLEKASAASWSRPAAPITAAHVTNDNAHQLSQALWDEMDREARQESEGIVASTNSPCQH